MVSVWGVRVSGIYSPDGGGVEEFLESQRTVTEGAQGLDTKTLTFPEDRPVVAVVVARGRNVPVEWATRSDGSFIVIDGEIYNWGALTSSSVGGTSQAQTDPGWLLDQYLARGLAVLSQIDGAAVITVWDAPNRRLTLARDRSGIVPGFYAGQSSSLVWGSHINALTAAGIEREIHLPALDYLLGAHYVPSPWTFVCGIEKIPPAHIVTWDGQGETRLERYWLPTGRPKFEGTPEAQVDAMQGVIEDAVRKRVSANGRTGVLLSGGVDSKLVAVMAARTGCALETFTFQYTDYEGELNETVPARALADHFGLPHHIVPFGPSDLADNLDDMVRSFGEPFDYGVHTYMVSQVKAAGVDAVLTGVGADGWYLSPTSRFGLLAAGIPSGLRRLGEAVLPGVRLVSSLVAEKVADILQEARVGMPIVSYPRETNRPMRASLFREGGYDHAGEFLRPQQMAADFAALAAETRQDRLTFAGLNYYSADTILYWNNAWSRAYDLPIRHPYFDSEVYDFLMHLPRRKIGKLQFRELAARIMPRHMAYAPKVYQAAPLSHWFRGPLRELLRDRLAPDRIRANGLFDPAAVARVLKRHDSGYDDLAWLLMLLLTITVWQELGG